MSLLNAALRKKDKENQRVNAPALFNKIGKTPAKTKLLIYGLIACLAIAIGLAIPYLTNMFLPKRISPPLPQPPDIIVTAKQENTKTANSSQPADISHKQELKGNEADNDSAQKPSSIIPAQTKETSVEEKIEIKAENKLIKPSKPKLLNRPAQNTSSALPSQSVISPSQKAVRPELIKPFYEKAVRYHRQNRFKEAIMMYKQVLDKDPQDRDTLFNLACAYLDNREFAAASPILYSLYEKEPHNPLVMINLAIARIETGEPAMAIALLDAAQKITNAPLFDIYFHKAAALSSLGQLDEAKQFYEMAEKNNPGNTRLMFNMAVLYDKMKNYKDALRYYRAFLAKNSLLSDIEKKSVEDRILILNVFVEREKNQIP